MGKLGGKIIEKYEIRVDGQLVQARIRMETQRHISGCPTQFRGEAPELNLGTGMVSNIDVARKELEAKVRAYSIPGDWKKHLIVRFETSISEPGEQQRWTNSDPHQADLTLSWRPIWLGKYKDGSPCYRRDGETGNIVKGAPDITRFHDDDGEVSTMIEATPEIEAGLMQIKDGMARLGARLLSLLGKDKIVKTLTALNLPALTFEPETKRKANKKEIT